MNANHIIYFSTEGFTRAIFSKTPKSKWSFLKLLSIETIVIKSFQDPFLELSFLNLVQVHKQFLSPAYAFCYQSPLC